MLMLFLTVALVHLVALLSPGPDFFFVSQTAVSRSRKEAMMGVLGITMRRHGLVRRSAARPEPDARKNGVVAQHHYGRWWLYLCWMGYQMLRGALKKEKPYRASRQKWNWLAAGAAL